MSLGPLRVVVDRVDGEADDLDVPAVELGLDLGHVAELGRADRGEVLRVREQHGPRVADPVVEADRAFRRLRLEVGCRVADLQSHVPPSASTGRFGPRESVVRSSREHAMSTRRSRGRPPPPARARCWGPTSRTARARPSWSSPRQLTWTTSMRPTYATNAQIATLHSQNCGLRYQLVRCLARIGTGR